MFAFLIFFSRIPVVGWWSSKSADEAQLQLMELKVSWWSSSGADGGYYIKKSLLLITLFLSIVCAVHKCLHSIEAVGSHSRWSFRPLVLFLYEALEASGCISCFRSYHLVTTKLTSGTTKSPSGTTKSPSGTTKSPSGTTKLPPSNHNSKNQKYSWKPQALI